MGEGGFSLPANGRIISMFVEWQRRAGGRGRGSLYLVRMTTAEGGGRGCVWERGLQQESQGGTQG